MRRSLSKTLSIEEGFLTLYSCQVSDNPFREVALSVESLRRALPWTIKTNAIQGTRD